MQINCLFFLNSLLFGIGLAVDAFLVALANGMNYPLMRKRKTTAIAVLFMTFQIAAVMLGWLVAASAFKRYPKIEIWFAWGAVAALVILGTKMLSEARKNSSDENNNVTMGVAAIVAQCAATSVDALTVGFTIEEYGSGMALACSAIIGTVTFITYVIGFAVGKRFGMKFKKAASVIGGIVFIGIAVEILITTYI